MYNLGKNSILIIIGEKLMKQSLVKINPALRTVKQ